MKSNLSLLIPAVLLLSSALLAESPPANTIPVIGLKPAFEGINVDFLCFLSWNSFDGLSRQGYNGTVIQEKLVIPADSTGMLAVVNPDQIAWITHNWTRMFPFSEDYPYVLPVWKNYSYGDSTYTEDAIIESKTVAQCTTYMQQQAAILDTLFNQETSSVWFYYGFDEAPAFQWARMLVDTIDGTPAYYNDFIPSLFTQAMDSVCRPDLELSRNTVWQPALSEVDSRGTLSWMNWYLRQADSTREIGYVISSMHTLKDWAGATNINEGYDSIPPNAHDQAQAVRAIFNMQYRGAAVDATPEANNPSFVALDAYPYRLVGTAYQDTASYTPALGDSLELWLIDHYEEVMDSTFITAWNIRNDDEKDVSVFFVPQSFGRAGGGSMWDEGEIVYDSYNYRIPTPQEFRMTCNSALLRGAKALFPFCLVTYKTTSGDQDYTNVGLLDRNNIPFDAPYEEWVYTSRLRSDIDYIPPDSIPPFMSGYDPLYSLPTEPTPPTAAKETETYLEWKFAAYARLWNSAKRTLGDIARVAPELARLNWWEDYEDNVEIEYDGTEPSMFITPQAKVFTDSTGSYAYIYYLNRFCRANNNPFEVTIDAQDFLLGTPFSEYALDHNRRYLIEGTEIARDEYSFLDTLEAGEGRLLEMISSSSISNADIRITDPDISVILPADNDTLMDNTSVPGETVDICAAFYNMGMGSLSDLEVYLYDDTDNELLGKQHVSFSGLDTDSCYRCDRDDAIFSWTPDSDDIGVHRLRVYTDSISMEPDPTDNSAGLVYVVSPRDYATEVLDNPWDMTEATGLPYPLWNTNDITAMTGWNTSLFTDSISGMFEGTIPDPSAGNTMKMNTGTASGEWIDTDTYHNLSLAGKASRTAGIEIHWIDSHNDTSYIDTGEELTSTWQEIGPVDLSGAAWNSLSIKKLWFEFTGGNLPATVRIGWIKLTE